MAEIQKFGASEVLFHIRHDLRELPANKDYGNESIIPEKSMENYSLLDRCRTAKEANQYRKQIQKECFSYNRKNLIHAVEVVVQCPDDCPPEQTEVFFQETFKYICSTLPMGERCVFVAEVHVDEKHYTPSGEMISKKHLHVMYVPAVHDHKHEGFAFKLCADALTKRAKLKEFHPGLQSHLDTAGISATVYRKKEGNGKTIALSVKQLKEITEKTGMTIEKSITITELAEILKTNREITIYDKQLKKQLQILEKEIEVKNTSIQKLQEQLQKKELIIQEKDRSIQTLEHTLKENITLKQQLQELQTELEHSRKQIHELEIRSEQQYSHQSSAWGEQSSWGSKNTWGNAEREHTDDKLW